MSSAMEWYFKGYFCWLNQLERVEPLQRSKEWKYKYQAGILVHAGHPVHGKTGKDVGFTTLGEKRVYWGWYYGEEFGGAGRVIPASNFGLVILGNEVPDLIKRINRMCIELQKIELGAMYVDAKGNLIDNEKVKVGAER